MSIYDAIVERHGFSLTQRQTIDWVPPGSRVLELGCAGGHMGAALIAKGCTVHAVEIDAPSALRARERGLEVFEGSLEDEAFLAGLRRAHYDTIIATDVLEHLKAPGTALRYMHDWLRPDGHAIVAVPNIATWSMRVDHARGRFEYQDTGQLDRTHLRFFTWDTFHRFVEEEGWQVDDAVADSWELPGLQSALFEWPRRIRARLDENGGPKTIPAGAFLHDGAGRLMQLHAGIAAHVGPRFPNLCATHVLLRLQSAPARRVASR